MNLIHQNNVAIKENGSGYTIIIKSYTPESRQVLCVTPEELEDLEAVIKKNKWK